MTEAFRVGELRARLAVVPMPTLDMPAPPPPVVESEGGLTGDQVRRRFERNGKSFTDWARRHGFKVSLVYSVLNGSPSKRGKSHNIAVLLGMKHGVAQVGSARAGSAQPAEART